MHKKEYFITHIINEKTPSEGFKKVFFFTQISGFTDKYFWGIDNNSYDQEYIDNLISKGKIFKIKTPIKLQDDTTLFVDSQGNYFMGHYQGGDKINVNKNI